MIALRIADRVFHILFVLWLAVTGLLYITGWLAFDMETAVGFLMIAAAKILVHLNE